MLSFASSVPVITKYSSLSRKESAHLLSAQHPYRVRPIAPLKCCPGTSVVVTTNSKGSQGRHQARQSNPSEVSGSESSNLEPRFDSMLDKLENKVSVPFSQKPNELSEELRDFIGENDFKMTTELKQLANDLTTEQKGLSDMEIIKIMSPEQLYLINEDDSCDELGDPFYDGDDRETAQPYAKDNVPSAELVHDDDAYNSDPSAAFKSGPLEMNSDAFESQLNPRKVDGDKVKKRISKLKQRKRRLAVERGLDESKALHYAVPSTGDAIIDHFAHCMNLAEREPAENLTKRSLSCARVIDFVTDTGSSRGGAMTTCARFLMQEVMCVPLIYRPFFGLQSAFETLDAPPCPRCKRPTPPGEASIMGTICDSCYAQVYVEDPYVSSSHRSREGFGPEARAQRKVAEAKITADAVALSKELMNEQATSGFPLSMSVSGTKKAGSKVDSSNLKSGEKRDMSNYCNGSGSDDNVKEPPTSGGSKIADDWNVRASDRSMRTINPIRNLVQNIDVKPNPNKELIKLSVGDPTVYGNLKVSSEAISCLKDVIQSGKANGYTMSMGTVEARAAVAKRYSVQNSMLSEKDVLLCSGTSGALEIAIGVLANEGDNILLPRPGFPLFKTISEGFGVECRYYRVNPERNWEIELEDLMELADDRTAAIVINNPSNPCGSVFSESHIEDLLAMASLLKLPIIADEVYADMVFSKEGYVSIGSRASDVPVLSVGGVSKQFVVPGWRLGWILIHDRQKVLESGGVRDGLRQLTTRMLVPNTPIQMVLPTLLKRGTKDEAFIAVMDELRQNAEFTVKSLGRTTGLRCIRPQGAMYAMVEVDVERMGFADDMEFTKKLLKEEAVFVLPGQCFQAPNFVRVVFSAPRKVLATAFERMRAFCERHCDRARNSE